MMPLTPDQIDRLRRTRQRREEMAKTLAESSEFRAHLARHDHAALGLPVVAVETVEEEDRS